MWAGRQLSRIPSSSPSPSINARFTPPSSSQISKSSLRSTSVSQDRQQAASLSTLGLGQMMLASNGPDHEVVAGRSHQEQGTSKDQTTESEREIQLQNLKAILPFHDECILIAALDRFQGDLNAAAENVMTIAPCYGSLPLYSLSLSNPDYVHGTKKEDANSIHVNGVIKSFRMSTHRASPASNIKEEVEEASPKHRDGRPVKSRSSTPSKPWSSTPSSDYHEGGEEESDENTANKSAHIISRSDSSPLHFEEKAQEIQVIFPDAHLDDCKRIVQCADGNMEDAFEMMEEERGTDLLGGTLMNDGSRTVVGNAGLSSCHGTARTPMQSARSEMNPNMAFTKKRAAEEPNRAVKKTKALSNDSMNHGKIQPASQWVSEVFGEEGEVGFVFRGGTHHPCRFSRKLLVKHFSQLENFINANLSSRIDYNIDDDNQEHFDLLLQWVIARNMQPDPSKHKTRTSEITAILAVISLAQQLGLKDHKALNESMATYLTVLLSKQRTALESNHIRFAFINFENGHPIQRVFAKAIIRPLLEHVDTGAFRDRGMADSDDEIGDHEDAAHQSALRGNRFKFEREIEEFEQLALLVFRLQSKTLTGRWQGRQESNASGRKRAYIHGFNMIDPLTEKRFFIN